MRRFFILISFLLVLSGVSTKAEERDTTVYFVNVYPGPEVYELEGHSAILVEISGQQPLAYNFGVFDFEAPNFVYRFVKGETDYRAVEWPQWAFLESYARQGRRVVAHELNFDSAQKARLISLLRENVKPENAVYRYNYVKDNCATRPLAVVERAAGDTLLLGPSHFETEANKEPTFRNVMRYYHKNYPWYQFGIDLALGYGIDYRINNRETAFAPTELDHMLSQASVGGIALVKDTHVLVDVPSDNAIKGPTPWYATPMFISLLIFVVALIITVRDLRRRRVTPWFDAIYFAILGIAGLVLTFLIFISVHEATSPNLLYLWLNPLCLLVPILIWIKRAKIVLIWWQIINFVVLLLLVAAWYFLPQSANAAFLPLVLADMMRSASFVYINSKQRYSLIKLK
ncbi:MAG: DUF4105 domain-containing protein [Muribaculaceae bacterium]|nr:DUF4105 domain-containing protein [Muribaculaceae bacterium]